MPSSGSLARFAEARGVSTCPASWVSAPRSKSWTLLARLRCSTPTGMQSFGQGFLAGPINIGHHTRNVFSVVPEIGFNVGYQVTEHVRLFAGCNFLYWTQRRSPRIANRPDGQPQLFAGRSPPPAIANTGPRPAGVCLQQLRLLGSRVDGRRGVPVLTAFSPLPLWERGEVFHPPPTPGATRQTGQTLPKMPAAHRTSLWIVPKSTDPPRDRSRSPNNGKKDRSRQGAVRASVRSRSRLTLPCPFRVPH